jgi:hypothetical protein
MPARRSTPTSIRLTRVRRACESLLARFDATISPTREAGALVGPVLVAVSALEAQHSPPLRVGSQHCRPSGDDMSWMLWYARPASVPSVRAPRPPVPGPRPRPVTSRRTSSCRSARMIRARPRPAAAAWRATRPGSASKFAVWLSRSRTVSIEAVVMTGPSGGQLTAPAPRRPTVRSGQAPGHPPRCRAPGDRRGRGRGTGARLVPHPPGTRYDGPFATSGWQPWDVETQAHDRPACPAWPPW